MDFIVKPNQLMDWMNEQEIRVIDVRSNLQHADKGEEAYLVSHLPGAFYLHLNKDLSGTVEQHGGNHPLPDITVLAEKLGDFGITAEMPVVIYDTANDMFAARLWWLLQYIGHKETYILDGGYKAWVEAGYEVTAEIPEQKRVDFQVRLSPAMKVTMEEVKNRDKSNVVLIDSRSRARYLGEMEPLYDKAGHIPGAKNFFWKEVLDENGAWKTKKQLQAHFAALNKTDQIIVSCGSGISACPNIVALKQAGFDKVSLYPGSFSDWISYPENPVQKGVE